MEQGAPGCEKPCSVKQAWLFFSCESEILELWYLLREFSSLSRGVVCAEEGSVTALVMFRLREKDSVQYCAVLGRGVLWAGKGSDGRGWEYWGALCRLAVNSFSLISLAVESSEYLRVRVPRLCFLWVVSRFFWELTFCIRLQMKSAHCSRTSAGLGLLCEPSRQSIFLQPACSSYSVSTWMGFTSLSSFEMRKQMGIRCIPGLTISFLRSISIRLMPSLLWMLASIRLNTAPNTKSGRPVRDETISFSNCLKLQNGLSRTSLPTLLGCLLAQRRAVTAPMDLPHRFTLQALNLSCKNLTTLARSLASLSPMETNSPSLTPEPLQSNRQTTWPCCSRCLQYSSPSSRDPLLVCRNTVTQTGLSAGVSDGGLLLPRKRWGS